jgi:hypothetical protein
MLITDLNQNLVFQYKDVRIALGFETKTLTFPVSDFLNSGKLFMNMEKI